MWQDYMEWLHSLSDPIGFIVMLLTLSFGISICLLPLAMGHDDHNIGDGR